MDWFDYGYDDAFEGRYNPPSERYATQRERDEYAKGWGVGNMDYWQYVKEA